MEKKTEKAVDRIFNNMRVDKSFVKALLKHISDTFTCDGRFYYYKDEQLGMYPVDEEFIIKDFIIFYYGL